MVVKKEAQERPRSKLHIVRDADRLRVNLGSTRILVETAKKPGKPWSEAGREDIETARATYRVIWGDVPSWDAFDLDGNTHNYIAYVQTDHKHVVEALSNRMVLSDPEDLAFYQVKGIPLKEVLADQLYRNRGLEVKLIAAESRIGAIRSVGAVANSHTVEAFAAIKLQMVVDARKLGVEYIVCQTRPDMPVTKPIDGVHYEFPPTEKVIGLSEGSIKLNRDNPTVAWHILHFPGYFLETAGIHDVVQQAISEGLLSVEEFRRKTGLVDVSELLKPRNIKTLVPLITAADRLGVTLQDRFLNHVPDGTYSSISHIDDIEKKAMAILERAAEVDSS